MINEILDLIFKCRTKHARNLPQNLDNKFLTRTKNRKKIRILKIIFKILGWGGGG